MRTAASKQAAVQHPVDGSLWVFSDADAWGQIGAVHLTETAGSLRVDWTDGQFIDDVKYGTNGSDPENPNLALAADPSTASLALAYQSGDRQTFTNGTRSLIGSRIAIARITAAGAASFQVLPDYAERVSAVGLVVLAGETVVSYRPIDPTTITCNEVYVRRFRSGAWEPAVRFGTINGSTDRITYAAGRAEFATRLSDGRIHLRTF
jgi:hypothetical protein